MISVELHVHLTTTDPHIVPEGSAREFGHTFRGGGSYPARLLWVVSMERGIACTYPFYLL